MFNCCTTDIRSPWLHNCSLGLHQGKTTFRQLRARRALLQIKKCSIENQKGAIAIHFGTAIAPFWFSTGTSLNCNNALLALKLTIREHVHYQSIKPYAIKLPTIMHLNGKSSMFTNGLSSLHKFRLKNGLRVIFCLLLNAN